MNYYITILSSNDDYDEIADKMLKLFGTLHIFLRNDIKTIEIKDHDVDQPIYDKLTKIINDLDATAFMFKADPEQMEQMCASEVETIPTLML